MRVIRLLVAFAALLVAPMVGAQDQVPVSAPLLSIEKVEELPYGTPVYGFSSLRPGEPTKFTGHILGVMHGKPGPGHNWIGVALDPESIPVVAGGQSGSPMYVDVDGVLHKIGTLSFGPNASKNPICYLTPIAEVLNTSHTAPVRSRASPQSSNVADVMRRLLPMNDRVRGMLGNMLAEEVSSGVSARGPAGPIVPGTVLGVQLAWGDFDYTSYGTVSHIDGSQVFMFGHPFLQLGPVEYRLVPMKVFTVVQSYSRSYILAVPVHGAKAVGVITQDRETAIYGALGREPQNAIPVSLSLVTSSGIKKEFAFHVISDPDVGPVLIGAGVTSAIESWSRELGDLTLFVSGTIQVEGQGDIEFSDSFSSSSGPFQMLREKARSVLGNRFSRARIKSVTVQARVFDEIRKFSIDSISLDQPNFKPGETVNLKVTLGQPLRDSKTITLPIQLPVDLRYGVGRIVVGDHDTVDSVERNGGDGNIVNLSTLVASLNQKRRPDAVYVYIVLPPSHAGPPTAGKSAPMQVGDVVAQVTQTSRILSSNGVEYQIVVEDFQVSGRKEVEFKVGTSNGTANPHH